MLMLLLLLLSCERLLRSLNGKAEKAGDGEGVQPRRKLCNRTATRRTLFHLRFIVVVVLATLRRSHSSFSSCLLMGAPTSAAGSGSIRGEAPKCIRKKEGGAKRRCGCAAGGGRGGGRRASQCRTIRRHFFRCEQGAKPRQQQRKAAANRGAPRKLGAVQNECNVRRGQPLAQRVVGKAARRSRSRSRRFRCC